MEERKLKLEDLLEDIHEESSEDKIEKVAIIGAGVMGQGIAQSVASAGIDVIIIEKNQEFLDQAKSRLIAYMDHEIARWAMTSSDEKGILNKIEWTLDFSKISSADVIVEAVEENFQLKRMLFKKADELAKPNAVLVSNTSTLSLTKIAEITNRKEQVIGMHFLNPVPKIGMVELIKCFYTSDETVEKIKSFAAKIGKTAVEVYEYPGFVTTRAIVPLLNEAMHILLEGIATAKDIDTAMKLGYDFKKGPLEMADEMGLDEVLAWMEQMWSSLGEPRYRPCPLLRKLVRERKLGKKTGQGFYSYDENGNIIVEREN